MKAQHTQGEWKSIKTPNGLFNIRITGKNIATIYDFGKDGESAFDIKEQQEANAKLIAAAPELLEALKEMMSVPYDTFKDAEKFGRASDAIKKATK